MGRECVAPASAVWPVPTIGYTDAECCEVKGKCAGNNNADLDAICFPGTKLKEDHCRAFNPAWGDAVRWLTVITVSPVLT